MATQNEFKSKIEALQLNLDNAQAQQVLNWEPLWNQSMAIEKTVTWWSQLIKGFSAETLTFENISAYLLQAKKT